MNVGVIALQGAVSEHIDAVKRAMQEMQAEGKVYAVRNKSDLEIADCLILPGGESTTISKLLDKFGMLKMIRQKAKSGMPIMGTCTGCILMAKKGDYEVEKTDTKLLFLMDMKVTRNAFGRQKESFETALDIKGLKKPFPALFIRAPAIERVWGNCKVLATFEDKIVMTRQGNLIAAAFHPELTNDTRIHALLLKMIMKSDF